MESIQNLKERLFKEIDDFYKYSEIDGIEVMLAFNLIEKEILDILNRQNNETQPVDVEVVEITPEQIIEVEQIKKERPAIDLADYSKAEALEREEEKRLEELDKLEKKKSKRKKAIAVETFEDIRHLDDELF